MNHIKPLALTLLNRLEALPRDHSVAEYEQIPRLIIRSLRICGYCC